ncbi:hypothetical protein [Aphanothece hegewaldii]|uniref:hypothetical protein n=1 Tax=Aphanothece hegewaldii TaxID=1521625 RepID=UPI003CCC155C
MNNGNNLAFPPEIKFDVAGNPRIFNGTIDLGAFEFLLDPAQYGASYRDLIPYYINAGYNLAFFTNHYYSNGRFEGRSIDSFDEFRYIASNAGDLIGAFGLNGAAATLHYLNNGYTENRSTTAFIPSRYLNSYPDLFNLFAARSPTLYVS